MKDKINILGMQYRIEIHKVSEDEYLRDRKLAGYCSEESRKIVVADMSEKDYFDGMNEKEQEIYRNRTLRHEIIHAFLNESGLSDSASVPACAWSKHEEMIDWFAIQSPKIFAAYLELGISENVDLSKTSVATAVSDGVMAAIVPEINKGALKRAARPVITCLP